MKNTNANNTLLGKRVEIRLEAHNKEALEKLRRPIPGMPTVRGTIVRRFYFLSWGYVVKLDEPLTLDREGINPDARKKISTSYLMAYMFSTDIYNGKDPLYLELTGKANRMIESDELYIIIRYINNLEDVPSEIGKNDQFLKDNPADFGKIKLIG